MLDRLRLVYKTRGEGTNQFHMVVPSFGIVFKFHLFTQMSDYDGWDIIEVNLDELEINDQQFGENLMFLLISKGYMAYLRHGESGMNQAFRNFLIREGWALKIIDKRLELYNNEPRHKFMIERNIRLRDMSVHYIIMHHPDFFDYLW